MLAVQNKKTYIADIFLFEKSSFSFDRLFWGLFFRFLNLKHGLTAFKNSIFFRALQHRLNSEVEYEATMVSVELTLRSFFFQISPEIDMLRPHFPSF